MAPKGPLRIALREKLLDGMIRKVKPKSGQWKVLVVDREALRILAAAVQLTELVNEGVTIVEMLDLRREPLPRLPAIYFITPTAESISLFTSEDKAQYREYHLFFTSRLPDYQMDVIRQNRELLRRVRNLVELDISLLAYESRMFSLNRPAGSLPHLFGNEGGLSHRDAVSEMSLISERLTDACSLVGQTVQWTVRADASSHVSRTISSLVKEQLETLRIEKMSKSPNPDEKAAANAPKKATLIVLDRATDVITPLIHEFSYQAMLHDLIKLDYRKPGGAHYEVEELDGKNLPIDDEDRDPIWGAIRHKFIEDAKRLAAQNMQHFLETNAAFKIGKKEAADIDIADMTKAVRNLPEAQMQRDRYAMHLSAMKECMEHVGAMKIPDLAIVEQELAIGSHADGTRCASKTMAEKLLELLSDQSIPIEHRIRTLLIARAVATEDNIWMGGEASLLCQSTPFKQKMKDSRLLNLPGLGRDLDASIHGLRKILTFTKTSSVPKGPESATIAGQYASKIRTKVKERKAYRRAEKDITTRRGRRMLDDPNAVPFDVARYSPPMRGIVADLVNDCLDDEDFPITGAVDVDSIIKNIINKQEQSPPSLKQDSNPAPRSRQVLSRATDAISALRHREEPDDEFEAMPVEADPDHLYMVFIVGGVCYSEVRSVYEVCDKRGANIIVGGTHVLTPRMFLGALGGIADSAMKIKVLLPPLPLDLAQMRQEREKTMKAMREQDRKEEKRKQPTQSRATASSSSSTTGSQPADSSVSSAGGGGGEVEAVTVESYRKPSRMKRWFGGKK